MSSSATSGPSLAISEPQFDMWSHQGAVDSSKRTYASVQCALGQSQRLPLHNYDIFLQGSYGNDTNIRSDSDVDVLVTLNDAFRQDVSQLTPSELFLYNSSFSTATYAFPQFRKDVLDQLTAYYGKTLVTEGKNSIKLKPASGRLGADVIVCLDYRRYIRFNGLHDQSFVQGIAFDRTDGVSIINYPKLHSANCTAKNKATSGWFKPTVRIFKNMRRRLVDAGVLEQGVAPSYFIECMVYNVPNECFGRNYQSTILDAMVWISKAATSKVVCANAQTYLFGDRPEQWRVDQCQQYFSAVANLILGQ
ncbi:MAG: nucleotidyltransferase [Bryobacterales bacterium]|nr:nucleotidyltransferase [Bryobacterales bacterium]